MSKLPQLATSLAWLCALSATAMPGAVPPPPDAAAWRTQDPLRAPARPSPLAPRAVLIDVASAGTRLVAVGERGHIVLSDDQGRHWRQASVPVSTSLTAVHFVDEREGWAVGHGGVILHSGDGGEHWTRQLDGEQAIALLAAMPTATEDERQRVAQFRQDGPDKPFLAVHFQDRSNGLAVGAYGLAFSTRDGGRRWEPMLAAITNPQERHIYTIHPRPDGLYLAGEQGAVWRRAPGQNRFELLPVPFQNTVFDLFSDAGGTLVAIGLGGKLHRSSDGGRHWETHEPAGKEALSAGLRAGPVLVLVGESGRFLISRDGGRSARAAATDKPFPLAGLALIPGGQLVAVGALGARTAPLSALAAAE